MNVASKKICPDEERLADYLEGRLSKEARSQIEEHMSDCEVCLDAFVISRGFIRGGHQSELESVQSNVTQDAVRLINSRDQKIERTSLWSRLNRSVERSVKDLHQWSADLFNSVHWGELAYAPTRGPKERLSNDLQRLRRTFTDIRTEIEIEKRGEGKALIRIKLIEDIKGKSIRATLKQGEREIYSDLLNNGNHVLLEDVPFGSYNLVLTREGVELGTYRFKIKDTNTDKKRR